MNDAFSRVNLNSCEYRYCYPGYDWSFNNRHVLSLRYHLSNLCSLAHLQACKAIRPLFYRLAHENSNVLFVEVPVTETNANLHQGLGIPSLPYGHIYSPDGGLVEELKITRPHFPKFAHKLSSYIKGSCELVNGHVESPYDPRTKELSATS